MALSGAVAACFDAAPAWAQSGSGVFDGASYSYSCSSGVCSGTVICPINGANISLSCPQGMCSTTIAIAKAFAAACFPGSQSVSRGVLQASQVSLGAVQTQIIAIRDSIQRALTSTLPPVTDSPAIPAIRGFASDVGEDRTNTPFRALDASYNTLDNSLAALAFADPKSPALLTKAAPPPSAGSWSAWSQGFVDYENRTGTLAGLPIGRDTTTGGGILGVDYKQLHLTSPTDAGVVGFLTGGTAVFVRNADGSTARVAGPSAGIYGSYINGGFSIDGTVKTDFLGVSQDLAGGLTNFGAINYTETGNVSYKFRVGTWWWEPTAGVSATETAWNATARAMGFSDGTDVRVTAGVRWGAAWDSAGIHYEGTVSTFLYDDAIIRGGTIPVVTGAPMAPTDEGKIFGQLIGKLQATLTKNWSAYVEGEVRGRTGVVGTAGRVGVRYVFD